MQKLLRLTLILLVMLPALAFAQGLRPQAIFSHSAFMMAGKSPYLETYLMVKGKSVVYKRNASGKFQASIEVILSVTQGDKVNFADRYNLLSPESDDSVNIPFNFLDQQRIPLSNGSFDLSLSIRDNNNPGHAKVEATEQISIGFPSDSLSISEIELIKSSEKADKPGPFNKGGYTLIPHINDFYPAEEDRLIFYAEIYRSLEKLGEDEKFLLNYFIEDITKNEKLEAFSGFKRFNSATVNVVLAELNIAELYSGNFRLILEVRDKNNTLLRTQKTGFTRYNPYQSVSLDKIVTIITEGSFAENYKNPDSLAEHIRCLSPISSPRENAYAQNLVKEKNLKNMQQFFLGFWKNRNPQNPGQAWEKYFNEVRKVEATFATSIRKGYTTDRGRVYLQYGPPDNRTQSYREPTAYPYEIWQYYKINNQSNRRFVFYNPDLVTNEFPLIHSDALGEIMNDQWMFMILKRDTQTNDIDEIDADPHYGSQLKQNFQTPR